MKRLMLDYFRRWWWVLVIGATLELVMGWFAATHTENNNFDPASSFQFQIALFTGAFLLSFDLQRGAARTVAALPLTARQIGRAWWLMTVGIPATVLISLLGLGAGLFHWFHPATVFPVNRLGLASLFTLLSLGSLFTLIFNTTQGMQGSRPQRAFNLVGGGLVGLMIGGGFIIFQDITNNPIKCALFIGVGSVLTVVGWFRAGQFVVGRASFRVAGLQTKAPRGQHRAPIGFGGVPLLIRVVSVRAFLIGLAMIVMMPLFLVLQGRMTSWREVIDIMGGVGNFFPFYFIILFQIIPSLTQLRFLRTLPLTASHLAAVMFAIVLLPLIALGVLVAGFGGLVVGASASLAVLKSYTFTLAPASLCIFFFIWRGVGVQAFAALILTMVAFQFVPLGLQSCFQNRVIPFSLMAGIAGGCILLSFLGTRRLLTHSSRVYRVQAIGFGGANWGAVR
ncbi:MAG: hypothetical protein WCO56_08295 [Verrucomicrobiota bacterium]